MQVLEHTTSRKKKWRWKIFKYSSAKQLKWSKLDKWLCKILKSDVERTTHVVLNSEKKGGEISISMYKDAFNLKSMVMI